MSLPTAILLCGLWLLASAMLAGCCYWLGRKHVFDASAAAIQGFVSFLSSANLNLVRECGKLRAKLSEFQDVDDGEGWKKG